MLTVPSVVMPSERLSSETALLGCRRPLSDPPPLPPPPLPPRKNLDASKDLCPGTYLALERQNLHRPGLFFLPEAADAADVAAGAPSLCCKVSKGGREIV